MGDRQHAHRDPRGWRTIALTIHPLARGLTTTRDLPFSKTEMGNRPQTLYGIADSPVGLAAWMIDHDVASYELIGRAFVGQPGGLSRDDILDNVTHYWLTNTAISSARLYWESKLAFFDVKGVDLPVGVTVFPGRALSGPAELGGEGLSQPHPLQRGRRRRPLRCLGAAADPL